MAKKKAEETEELPAEPEVVGGAVGDPGCRVEPLTPEQSQASGYGREFAERRQALVEGEPA